MPNERMQEGHSLSETLHCTSNVDFELVEGIRGPIDDFVVFELAPDVLLRIEFRCVWWEGLEGDTTFDIHGQKLGQLPAPMNTPTVPEDQHAAGDAQGPGILTPNS